MTAPNLSGHRFGRPIFLLLALAYAFFRLPPWSPRAVGVTLDRSWAWVSHEAWLLGLQHGREIAFTFGPYGFVLTETYHPETFGLMLAIHVVLAGLFAAVMWQLFSRLISAPWLIFVSMVAVFEFVCVWDVSQSLFFHLCVALLVWHWVDDEPGARLSRLHGPSVLGHLLAVGVALSSLIKFSHLTFAVVVLTTIVLHDLFRRRRLPSIAVTFLGSWILFWMLAGQRLSGIPSYLEVSARFAGGFNAAMGLDGPRHEFVLYLVAAVLLAGYWATVHWKRCRLRCVIPVGGLVAILFLMFKIGFVRHDAHALTPAPFLLPWCLLAVTHTWSRAGSPCSRLPAVLCMVAALAYAAVVVPAYRQVGLPALWLQHLGQWPRRVVDVTKVLAGGEHLRRQHEALIAQIRAQVSLPTVSGTVDLYSAHQGILLAHGLDYRPRPVFHSYAATTPGLSRMNADHLRSARAADHIFFSLTPIDDRLPALDDSLSIPELLARYDVEAIGGRNYVLLRRSAAVRNSRLTPIMETTARVGEDVALPEVSGAAMIWATAELRPTRFGKLRQAVYKPPVVFMRARLRGGDERAYRVVPELLGSGFLLSPLIGTVADYVALTGPPGAPALARKEVISIAVVGAGDTETVPGFHPEYELKLWELALE